MENSETKNAKLKTSAQGGSACALGRSPWATMAERITAKNFKTKNKELNIKLKS
jgi:hypothetical protein